MISQMIRNGYLRFGGHVGIQVSYKILWSDVLKNIPSLQIHLALNRGCFEAVLMKTILRILGVKPLVQTGHIVSNAP